MTPTTTSRSHAGLIISLLVLTILFVPIFYTNYAYLDEAYQLWHNHDHSNYNTIFPQGRWLMGVLFDHSYAAISSIAGLKVLRIFSFFSMALFLQQFFSLANQWQKSIAFSNDLLFVSGIYIACSLSVAVYIGWASCFESGIALLAGVWSGSLLFNQLTEKKEWNAASIIRIAGVVLFGLCSLFMYQVAFGAFLIPFGFYLITKKSFAEKRLLLKGAGVYLGVMALYYLIFLLSIKISGITASNRTTIETNIIGKLGFFFGIPLSQAFSFNFLYNLHSVVSQAFPILMIVFWLAIYLKTAKDKPANKFIFIVGFTSLCMLAYIPVLVSKENFAAYRSMFVFNFIVAVLLVDTFLSLAKSVKVKTIIAVLLACCFICVGFRNFRYNFTNPLQQEYKLVQLSFNENYHTGIDTIYFLRPSEDIFYEKYGIHSYKDEFGLPSTFKDWTPESLMKQLILEKTGSRTIAEKATIIQFTEREAFEVTKQNKTAASLCFDTESLLK